MDMRLHWSCDREERKQFRIYWRPGGANLADYWTKHHTPAHHANTSRILDEDQRHPGRTATYAYATLRQSVAGNSPFGVLFFCNLGTSKTVILKFVTTVNIFTPYLSPCNSDHPNNVPVGQKMVEHKKKVEDKYVLIPWNHKLSHDR